MPYPRIRLSAAALVLLSGCATPGFFTASQGTKPNTEQAATSGQRPSQYTSSWSGNQNAGNQNARRGAQDNGAPAGAAVGDSERRIQDLLAAAERSQSAGDRRAARTAYEQVLRIAPGDAGANYQLAIMSDEEGRFAEAETHYFNVLRQAPNDPNVLASFGWSYFLQGRYDDSDRILREALRYDPNNKFALNNLGMLYGTRGDYDGALTIFRMAGSEADALKALALLKQNAGNVQVGSEQYVNTPVNPVPGGGSVAGKGSDSHDAIPIDESAYKTPAGRKLVEDYKRLKAENDKQQQEKRSRLAQKNISAPSPWNSNRQADPNSGQRDAGRATNAQGLVSENVSPSGIPPFKGNSADPVQINGRFAASDAAFPGAAPSQANRPRQADPNDFGSTGNAPAVNGMSANGTGANGNIPPFNPGTQTFPGTQANFEQPAAPRPERAVRSPIITPSGESPASRGNIAPTWNSLPRDDSYRGNMNGGNATPPADRAIGNNAGQFNAGQFNGGQPRANISNQDAQAAAAQWGLSAGSGGLGFPAADWPASPDGQTANPSNGSSPPAGGNFPDGQIPPSNQNPFSNQNAALSSNAPSNSGGSSLPPWPGRPLSSGTVPQAVVPSAQGVVYGSTGDPGVPNFYSGRPTVSPAR